MCLAMPARLIEVSNGELAVIELGGVKQTINVMLVPELQPGDYVIVHVGHAIGKLDPIEAERTLELFAELAQANARAQESGDEP